MADASTAAQIFAFAVFFVPGYLSLNIGSFLVTGVRLRLSWPEKVILSFVWSLVIYLAVFTTLGLTLTADSIVSELNPSLIGWLLVGSLVFGVLAGVLYSLGLRFLDILPRVGKSLGRTLGLGWIISRLEGFYFESASDRFLRSIYENREKNDVIVETTSDRTFRGMLGSLSVQPTLDVVLSQRVSGERELKIDQPLYEYFKDSDGWKSLKEHSIMIPQGNIRSVHAIRRGEGLQ